MNDSSVQEKQVTRFELCIYSNGIILMKIRNVSVAPLAFGETNKSDSHLCFPDMRQHKIAIFRLRKHNSVFTHYYYHKESNNVF